MKVLVGNHNYIPWRGCIWDASIFKHPDRDTGHKKSATVIYKVRVYHALDLALQIKGSWIANLKFVAHRDGMIKERTVCSAWEIVLHFTCIHSHQLTLRGGPSVPDVRTFSHDLIQHEAAKPKRRAACRWFFHKCSHFPQLVLQSIINGIISGVRTFGFGVPFLSLWEVLTLGWVERSVIKTMFSIQLAGESVLPLGKASENVMSIHATQASHLQSWDTSWSCVGGDGESGRAPCLFLLLILLFLSRQATAKRHFQWDSCDLSSNFHTLEVNPEPEMQSICSPQANSSGSMSVFISVPCKPCLDIHVKVSVTEKLLLPSTKFVDLCPLDKADNHVKQRGIHQKTAQLAWGPLRPA